MHINVRWRNSIYKADLSKPLNIAIPLVPNGENPNCFYAPSPISEPVIEGSFIGSLEQGGLLNFKNLKINPHGNGTHTESSNHIYPDGPSLDQVLVRHHFVGELVSVYPTHLPNGDRVILKKTLEDAVRTSSEALIVRTLPNHPDKKTRIYSGQNPPYFEPKALDWVCDQEYLHFLCDLPSVDREVDEGKLAAHKAFWKNDKAKRWKTISELIYVPDNIPDGLYFLNIQTTPIVLDVSPSRPVLYALTPEK